MSISKILSASGIRMAQWIRDGSVSAEELVGLHLARIDAVNPSLNAVVEVMREPALEAGRMVDRRRTAGESLRPLEGVPFSIKDSIEVEGTVCSAGTLGLRNSRPAARDATLVANLRGAGAIPLARTNLPDLLFAFESDNLIYGRTCNPHDMSRTSGGSSGGEAALIAACGSPFGLGSDAAGSVRLPAHYCGICSIKPTSGRLSRAGHVPAASGWLEMLWQIGPMARWVEDLWAMMPILLGSNHSSPCGRDRTVIGMPYGDPALVSLSELRIVFFTDNGIVPADADTDSAIRDVVRKLAPAVLSMEERRPEGIEDSYDLEMKLIGPDGGDALRGHLLEIGSVRTHPLLEGWLEKLESWRTGIGGFAEYWRALDRFRDRMFAFLDRCDAILSPVSAQPAVAHGRSLEDDVFRGFSYTMTHNLTGWPAAVVRCGTSREGLPIGVQIAARPWREDIALALARQIERENCF
jgi:amidase